MIEEVVFLDTNVFMYAAGAPHPYKESCVSILADVEKGILKSSTNTEVLQEILYRYSHLRILAKGLELCSIVMQYPIEILPVTAQDIRTCLHLYEVFSDQNFQPRDLIHAATMRSHGLVNVITADKSFELIPGIKKIDPIDYRTLV